MHSTVNVTVKFKLNSFIVNPTYTVTCTVTGGTVLHSSFTGQVKHFTKCDLLKNSMIQVLEVRILGQCLQLVFQRGMAVIHTKLWSPGKQQLLIMVIHSTVQHPMEHQLLPITTPSQLQLLLPMLRGSKWHHQFSVYAGLSQQGEPLFVATQSLQYMATGLLQHISQ